MSLTSPLLENEKDTDAQNDDNASDDQLTPPEPIAVVLSVENNDGDDDDGVVVTERKKISDVKEAAAYAVISSARNTMIMSNIFLFTSILYLANKDAGCDNDDEESCDKKIYGIRPSSLLPIGATATGLLACFFTPVMGALIDFTPYRKLLGIISASFLTFAQAILFFTMQETWLYMAILVVFNSFILQVQVLAIFSYLPEIARMVDDRTMATFTSRFTMLQFASMGIFVLIITMISTAFGLDDVDTSHVSQLFSIIVLSIGFSAWRLMPEVPANRKIPSDKNIITAGFAQNLNTFKGIHKYYGDGLKWFLISYSFGSPGVDAIIGLSMTYLSEVMEMDGSQLGIVFLIALLCSIPGAKLGADISKKYNPIISLKIFYVYFTSITIVGGILLDRPERKNLAYGLGVVWGLGLGWYHPTVNLIFSLSLPKGQEAELAGFFMYSGQIFNWLPSLVFTLLNEFGAPLNIAMMSLIIFYILGFCFLCRMCSWQDIRKSANEHSLIIRAMDDENDEQQKLFNEE